MNLLRKRASAQFRAKSMRDTVILFKINTASSTPIDRRGFYAPCHNMRCFRFVCWSFFFSLCLCVYRLLRVYYITWIWKECDRKYFLKYLHMNVCIRRHHAHPHPLENFKQMRSWRRTMMMIILHRADIWCWWVGCNRRSFSSFLLSIIVLFAVCYPLKIS